MIKQKFNIFFQSVKSKKQYLKKLRQKIILLESCITSDNYRRIPVAKNNRVDCLVSYVIDITFSLTNTLLHVMDPSGKIKFFRSAGDFNYSGKSKRTRFTVFREMHAFLISKLKFAKHKPIALHLKNVGANKVWIIRKLQKKFFIQVVRNFSCYPYNGCRKPKAVRKKVKKREEMAERFKAADCKSVE